jgi:hypothetical protein
MDTEPSAEHLPPLEWVTELDDGEMFIRAFADGETGREVVGSAKLKLFESFVYVSYTAVEPMYQKSGAGGILIDKVQNYLKLERKVGIREHQVSPQTSYAESMFGRHGWLPIDGHPTWMVFVPETGDQRPDFRAIDAMIEEANPVYMDRHKQWLRQLNFGKT